MTPAELHAIFARRIRALATEASMDLSQVAREAGIDGARFQSVMDGEVSPDIDEVAAVAAALGVEPATLLRDE